MNMFRAFMELDDIYESASENALHEGLSRQELIANLKALGKNYNFDKWSDAQLYRMWEKAETEKEKQDALKTFNNSISRKPVCNECGQELTDGGFCPNCDDGKDDLINESQKNSRTKSVYSCTECGYEVEMYNDDFDSCCPKCHDHHGGFGKCEEALAESGELSTEHALTSVVDRVKEVYEAGLFNKLPIGRDKAFTMEISGPDKERLAGYFKKQPEFNYELNNDSGIVSHEFISDKYDIEIFDTFVQMYRLPQNESLDEGVFDTIPKRSNWVTTSGSAISKANSINTQGAPTKQTVTPPAQASNVVTLVYDNKAHKLRARADDGIHGEANVAFPNNLRTSEGQQYEVDELIWNGKNYRVSGNIKPLNNVSNIQNINENINKETNKMNFIKTFAELDKLYEEVNNKEVTVEETAAVEETCNKEALTEEADEAEIPVDDLIADEQTSKEPIADEPKQLILECDKCGALIIKDEADVSVDKETDLANVEDECAFCEEKAGYKIIGTVAPYEVVEDEIAEEADEAVEDDIVEELEQDTEANEKDAENTDESLTEIFGLGKNKNKSSSSSSESKVTISIYDENGTQQFSQTFTEIKGKMSAEEQFNEVIKSNGVLNRYKSSPKKSDWSYERKSNPSSPYDTDKYFNAASKIIRG